MARPKGVPNKSSMVVARYLESKKINVPSKFVAILEDKTPAAQGGLTMNERLRGWGLLMEYVHPKRKAIDPDENGDDKPQHIHVTMTDELEKAVIETMRLNALPK